MSNSSNTLLETEETLRTVIKNLIDDQEGFKLIGENLKDELLKQYFFAESQQRARFRGELESLLHQCGVHDVDEKGTIAGTLHHIWTDVKVRSGGGDHSLLIAAEQAEDETANIYQDALAKELPLPIHQLLSTQSAHIQISYDYVKAVRDSIR